MFIVAFTMTVSGCIPSEVIQLKPTQSSTPTSTEQPTPASTPFLTPVPLPMQALDLYLEDVKIINTDSLLVILPTLWLTATALP